jgi:peptide/nickel transport system substrate-binding protein
MKKRICLFSVLAAILLVIPLLGACGGETTATATATITTTATATTTATTTATAPAKPEGTLVVATNSFGKGCFIPWMTHISSYSVYAPVYDAMGIRTSLGNYIPSVAESWEFSDDYVDVTFYLREGIQFHDGWGELTADDVAYVWENMKSPECAHGGAAYVEVIESIEVIDPYTIVAHQSEPNVDFMEFYALFPAYGAITCKKYVEEVGWEEANIHPIGSGPYKMVDSKTGDYIRYEAIDDHWRVVPEFKYLTLHLVPEESTRVAMLKTNAADITVVSPASITDLSGEEGITIEYWPLGCNSDIVFGGLCNPACELYKEGYHNQDPWADIRVREAMSIAIDRDAINEALHLGTAKPMTLVHYIPGYDEVDPIPYDPERARQLLAEAAADGVFTPNENGGFHFTLVSAPTHPGTPLIAKEAEAVVGYWGEIGITCDISPIEYPSYNDRVLAIDTAGECWTFRLTYEGMNPFSHLKQLKIHDFWWGTKFQCDASDILSPMAEAALAELDLEKRDALYREIAQVERDNWIGIPLIQVPYIVAKDNHTVGEWPPDSSSYYFNYEYIRHAEPLNTFRLFEIDDQN